MRLILGLENGLECEIYAKKPIEKGCVFRSHRK
jgi:hypothetical protein